MATVKEQILEALAGHTGMTDREITNVIKGRSEDQQGVNQMCRQLAAIGVLERRKRQDNLIGNYPTGKALPQPRTSSTGVGQSRSGTADDAMLSEDEVKTALKAWLEDHGWTVVIAWGRARGVDIDAVRGDERWIIEVKGCGSLSAMRVNYFLGVLGETLQRMGDPTARYSIALPEMKQFRGLWERLPDVAKERLGLSALFVATDGRVSVESVTTDHETQTACETEERRSGAMGPLTPIDPSPRRWARDALDVDEGAVSAALDRFATADLIATFEPDLVCCNAEASLVAALTDPAHAEFDFLPVRQDGRIVGLLPRAELAGQASQPDAARSSRSVGGAMQRLDETNLISADASFLTFIREADVHPCRFVIRGTRIEGIVTISDLQKLPVRPVLFALVTQLEILMAAVLRARFPHNDDWIEALTPKRRDKVEEKWVNLQRTNMALDKLAATDFCDKRDALLAALPLSVSKQKAKDELHQIEMLRNAVAHAGDYAASPQDASKLARTVKLSDHWTEMLRKHLRRVPT